MEECKDETMNMKMEEQDADQKNESTGARLETSPPEGVPCGHRSGSTIGPVSLALDPDVLLRQLLEQMGLPVDSCIDEVSKMALQQYLVSWHHPPLSSLSAWQRPVLSTGMDFATTATRITKGSLTPEMASANTINTTASDLMTATTTTTTTTTKEDSIIRMLEQQSRQLELLHQRLDHLTHLVLEQSTSGPLFNYPTTGSRIDARNNHRNQNNNNNNNHTNPVDFDRKIEELYTLVEQMRLQAQSSSYRQTRASGLSAWSRSFRGISSSTTTTTTTTPPRPTTTATRGVTGGATTTTAAAPARPPPQVLAPPLMAWGQQLVRPIQESYRKMALTIQLYHRLRRRQVPQFDMGAMIKVIVMITILYSRMSQQIPKRMKVNNPAHHTTQTRMGRMVSYLSLQSVYGWFYEHQFAILVMAVMLGFAIQSGLALFIYRFWFRDRFPARIWNGEDDIDELERQALLAPQPHGQARPPPPPMGQRANQPLGQPRQRLPQPILHHPPDGNAVGENARPMDETAPPPPQNRQWRNLLAFLQGEIAPRPQPRLQQPLILYQISTVLQDIMILMASFVLSIFPMWRPTPVPDQNTYHPVPPPSNGEADGNNDDDGGDDDDDSNGLPPVRPPRDALEPVHDDEDD